MKVNVFFDYIYVAHFKRVIQVDFLLFFLTNTKKGPLPLWFRTPYDPYLLPVVSPPAGHHNNLQPFCIGLTKGYVHFSTSMTLTQRINASYILF